MRLARCLYWVTPVRVRPSDITQREWQALHGRLSAAFPLFNSQEHGPLCSSQKHGTRCSSSTAQGKEVGKTLRIGLGRGSFLFLCSECSSAVCLPQINRICAGEYVY